MVRGVRLGDDVDLALKLGSPDRPARRGRETLEEIVSLVEHLLRRLRVPESDEAAHGLEPDAHRDPGDGRGELAQQLAGLAQRLARLVPVPGTKLRPCGRDQREGARRKALDVVRSHRCMGGPRQLVRPLVGWPGLRGQQRALGQGDGPAFGRAGCTASCSAIARTASAPSSSSSISATPLATSAPQARCCPRSSASADWRSASICSAPSRQSQARVTET